MKHISLLFAGLALAGSAQAVEFNSVQADKSAMNFAYKQMGVAMEGHFKKFSGQIAFDPAKPQAAKASLDIDLASIDTGSTDADGEVLGKAWFNAKAFPQARFVSSSVKALGGNRFEVSGKLSIKGRSKDTVAPVSFRQEGATGVFEGALVMKRADFAIGEGEWADFGTVANEIQIRFRLVAAAKK